jgi:hypothetical protein
MRERGTIKTTDGSGSFSKFVQFVKNTSLSRQNRFLVEINGYSAPDADINKNITNEQVSLLCDYTSHPAFSVHVKDAKVNNGSILRPDGVLDYHNVTNFSFLLDQNNNLKMYFVNWMNKIIDRETQYVGYQSDYLANVIKIHQLDMADNITYTTELYDAYPIEVSNVEVSQQASNAFNRISVQIAFSKWDGFSSNSQVDMDRINTTYDASTVNKFF